MKSLIFILSVCFVTVAHSLQEAQLPTTVVYTLPEYAPSCNKLIKRLKVSKARNEELGFAIKKLELKKKLSRSELREIHTVIKRFVNIGDTGFNDFMQITLYSELPSDLKSKIDLNVDLFSTAPKYIDSQEFTWENESGFLPHMFKVNIQGNMISFTAPMTLGDYCFSEVQTQFMFKIDDVLYKLIEAQMYKPSLK